MMLRALAAAVALIAASPSVAANATIPVIVGPILTYADLAELTLASPVIVRANVMKTERLSGENAPGLAADRARLLVHARVAAAILAPDAVPAELDYLLETPLDAKGKPPKLKDAAVLLFLRPGERPGQFALTSARAQLADAPDTVATVRSVLAEARTDLPRVTGITSAFRVPGSVPGEAESQFFVSTADARPISLVVLSRQGQERTLQLALGDVIDEAAAGVKPRTLLWYRLACFLPQTLPAKVGADDRAGLDDDYAFALAKIGRCERTK
ncbi:hypothetical protein KX816_11395 [Sphingosinicellaceae bacterium]|nr:hypothetical protein KX816_11395 [Sphingosinicellaceae bacterium]